MNKTRHLIGLILAVFIIVSLAGCTIIFQKGRRQDIEKIDQLSSELDKLRAAKALLEDRLRDEIAQNQVRLSLDEKGLVITFVAEVLFDSGKAKIRTEAYSALDKVARVLNENLSEEDIGIAGHTDNEPIKYSGWVSNWELSTARATSVLHYLVDDKGVTPERVSAIGHGEYKPVASNDTAEGRQMNRRVEIVIFPKISVGREQEEIKEPIEKLK